MANQNQEISLDSVPEILSMEVDDSNEGKFQRKTVAFKSMDSQYFINPQQASSQFYSLYTNRLAAISPSLKEKARKKWKGADIMPQVLQATESRCILVGTVIKVMPLKPNVLLEYSKERAILPIPTDKSFVRPLDVVYLVDESGRAQLLGAIDAKDFVSGTIIAVVGKGTDSGDFEVEEYMFPGFSPQKPFPQGKNKGKYVLLTSGFNIGKDDVNPLHFKLLVEFITGNIGSHAEHELQRNIVRVIIAGNSLCIHTDMTKDVSLRFAKREQSQLTAAVRELDLNLLALCSACHLDLMPGEKDPASFSIPQQPLNKCLLPRTSQMSTLNFATNPHKFSLGDVEFLGHSGQPIENMRQYLTETNIGLAKNTLKWQHLAPTAPDTLSCAASKHDPLVMTETPHIYFIGNQSQYYTCLEEGENGQSVRIIMIPDFSSTQTVVLLDLDSLECMPIKIASFDD